MRTLKKHIAEKKAAGQTTATEQEIENRIAGALDYRIWGRMSLFKNPDELGSRCISYNTDAVVAKLGGHFKQKRT